MGYLAVGHALGYQSRHFVFPSAEGIGSERLLRFPAGWRTLGGGCDFLGEGILCGLSCRHSHPLCKRLFPRFLAELGARGGHAGLVEKAHLERERSTDVSAHSLSSPPQPSRTNPLPLRLGQAGEGLQAVAPVGPAPELPV